MRVVSPGRSAIRTAAAKVPSKPDLIGRLEETDPDRPWDKGWGVLWQSPKRFVGMVSPVGKPHIVWLFAGRWVITTGPFGAQFLGLEYTHAEEYPATIPALSAAAGQVKSLYEKAKKDPAIPPPTVRNP